MDTTSPPEVPAHGSPLPVTAALRALVPPPGAGEAEFQAAFRRMADVLLNRAVWRIAGRPHRLTEVEFYFSGPGHADPFTHNDPLQRSFGIWYFHRQGGQYRGGTYKGLDIAFGRPDAAAGILLRGAEELAPGGVFIEGPSSLVDHILRLTGQPSVAALAGSFDLRVDPPPEGDAPLSLELEEPPRPPVSIIESARVGLSLKKGADPARRRFLAKPYRFLTEPARTKKGRPYVVIALHQEGRIARDIAALTGSSVAQVERFVAAYERGRGRDPEAYRRDLRNEDLCELLGALAASKPSQKLASGKRTV